MIDSFRTILSPIRTKTKIKSSKFIASAFPVENRKGIDESLNSVRREFHDAKHHCFAFKLGVGDSADFRYSDDGEPNGTAGSPIYKVIEGSELTNLLVVVTRYFGGTKLGVGRLVRAYTEAVQSVLAIAKPLTKTQFVTFQISCPYSEQSLVHRFLGHYHAKILSQEFDQNIQICCEIRKSEYKDISQTLKTATHGKISPILVE